MTGIDTELVPAPLGDALSIVLDILEDLIDRGSLDPGDYAEQFDRLNGLLQEWAGQ
jgi:hypothetical protein